MEKVNEILGKFKPTTHLFLYVLSTSMLISAQWTTQKIMIQDLKIQEEAMEAREFTIESRVQKLELQTGSESTQIAYITKQIDQQTQTLFEIERHLSK